MKFDLSALLMAAVVLLAAAALRFYNLAGNPGIYSDEGSLILAAQALADGEWNYLGIGGSNLVTGRMPLVPWLLSWPIRSGAAQLTALRTFSAVCGLFTLSLLIFLPYRFDQKEGKSLGLLAGAIYAVLPFTVLYNRLGFSYNLVAFIVMLIFWCLYTYLDTGQRKALLLAGILVGTGFLTDLWMLAVFPVVFLTPLFRNRNDFWPGLGGTLLIPGIYAAWMLTADSKTFLFDLNFIFWRVTFPLRDQIGLITANFSLLMVENTWIVLGLVGLFTVQAKLLRNLLLAFFFMTFVFAARSVALVGIGSYQFLPLSPFIVIGLATFHLSAWRYLNHLFNEWLSAGRLEIAVRKSTRRLLSGVFAAFLPGLPWLFLTVQQVAALGGSLPNELNGILVDPGSARESASFVNTQVASNDVVIASPAVAWMIDAQVTDFQVSLAYSGFESRHFPPDIPRERFTIDASIDNARYVVVDRLWDNWAAFNVPDIEVIFDEIAGWEQLAVFGEVRVYGNP